MTEQQLQAAIVEAIAEEVVRRVHEKLVAIQKKALVVCTGSRLSFSTWLTGLKRLEQEGFSLDLFLSHNAEFALDIATLRQEVVFGRVWQGEADISPEMLAADYPTIIVPAMTINTAAKIAGCTADTPASRIIFNSMMRGKNVIISVDGCCPDNPARESMGYALTEPLKEQLRANKLRLKDFGAVLTTADRLADKTLRVIGAERPTAIKQDGAKEGAFSAKPKSFPDYVSSRKIIGRQEIASLPGGATLRIPKGSQVTQLAADDARTRGISLIKDEV